MDKNKDYLKLANRFVDFKKEKGEPYYVEIGTHILFKLIDGEWTKVFPEVLKKEVTTFFIKNRQVRNTLDLQQIIDVSIFLFNLKPQPQPSQKPNQNRTNPNNEGEINGG